MRMRPRFMTVVFILLLATAGIWPVIAQAQEPGAARVRVDWAGGAMTAVQATEAATDGYNPARAGAVALRRGIMQARKGLFDAVLALRITGEMNGAEFFARFPEAEEKVRAFVQNSPIERPGVPGEPVRASVRLRGDFAELLFPPTVQFLGNVPPRLAGSVEVLDVAPPSLPAPAHAQRPGFGADLVPDEADLASMGTHTGLVVDARGLDMYPALLPVVYDASGVGVYGAFRVSRELAAQQGVVLYAADPSSAQVRRRAGARPLLVRAVGVAGSHRCDPLISVRDAEVARGLMRAPGVLENGRVVILLGDPVQE